MSFHDSVEVYSFQLHFFGHTMCEGRAGGPRPFTRVSACSRAMSRVSMVNTNNSLQKLLIKLKQNITKQKKA